MPLLPGKKNIGHNIAVEENHDKPKKQAVAIALHKAGVPKKTNDDLAPVGAEDPERALALAKHNAGVTKSQDKGARDSGLKNGLGEELEGRDLENAVATAKRFHGKVQNAQSNKVLANAWAAARNHVGESVEVSKTSSGAWTVRPSKSARDGALNAELDQAREAKETLKHKIETVEPVGAEFGKATVMLAKLASKVLSLEKQATKPSAAFQAADVQPVGDDKGLWDAVQAASKHLNEVKRRLIAESGETSKMGLTPDAVKQHPEFKAAVRAYQEAEAKSKAASKAERSAKDATLINELPVPIKTSNLVPMPSGEHNEERYAPRPAGDGQRREGPQSKVNYQDQRADKVDEAMNLNTSTLRLKILSKDPSGAVRNTAEKALRTRATDSKVILPEQRSGSAPEDHMHRANQYEIQGDRAQALDSYRAAASGYRKASDKANEVRARDGVEACQALFSGQYDHPGAGRVKVCDSAAQAVRTAVERTRAGESVFVTGKTVRPGRANDATTKEIAEHLGTTTGQLWRLSQNDPVAFKKKMSEAVRAINAKHGKDTLPKKDKLAYRALKQESEAHETNDDTGGPPPVDNPVEPDVLAPVPTGDEHEGFQKLEHSLAHEKGVKNPGAIAYKIGAEKYGKAGMAKKAAAGRAKDTELKPV